MLLCCAGAPFMIMLDSNIVGVALPSIARDFHGEFTDVEWVVSAYLLPFCALLMPSGALSDRFGRRRILVAGLSIFTLASLLCGLAQNLSILNGARALQAVGAALQLSSSLAVMAHGFPAKDQSRVYAIWGTVMGIAPSLGPILGGLFTSYLGWRWAFYINLPIGMTLMALAITSIDESRDPKAGRLDVPGIVLFGSGLFGVVWALIGANSAGWASVPTLLGLGAGAVLLSAFILVEKCHARAMIDLSLFRNPAVVGAALAMLGYAAAAQVMMTLLPVYLQDAFGQSPALAGAAMVPFALPLLFAPGMGGRLARHLSSRAILAIGLGLVALGDALTGMMVLAGHRYWWIAIGMSFIGAGAGLLNGETVKAQVSAVPPERAGMASGMAGTTRFIGINLGLAGLGAVLATVTEARLRRLGMPLAPGADIDWHRLSLRAVGGDVHDALSTLPPSSRNAIANLIHVSVAAGFGALLMTAAVVALISSLSSWLLCRPAISRPR